MTMQNFFKINRPLVPLKIINFIWVGGVYCMIPFLTIHMKDLGLTVNQTAIVYGIIPIVGFFSATFIGLIADKVGDFKIILYVLLPIGGILFMCLILVPPSSKKSFAHSDFRWTFFCNSSQNFIFKHENQETCSDCELNSQNTNYSLELKDCVPTCNSSINIFEMCYTINKYQHCQIFTKDVSKSFRINNLKLKENNLFHNPAYQIESFSTVYDALSHEDLSCKNLHNSDECPITCNVFFEKGYNCTCYKGNNDLTFWLYLSIRVTANIFTQMTFSVLNSLMIVMTSQFNGDYGRERIWFVLGIGIVSPLCGLVMNYVNEGRTTVLYWPPFAIFFSGALISLISVRMLVPVKVPPPVNIFKTACQVLKDFKTTAFLFIILFLGSYWGFLETFIYWFLNDLGSPKWLFGLIGPVRHLPSIPGLMFSKLIIESMGNINMILITYLFYGVRLVGYSYIIRAEWTLFFDVMVVFTEHLMWVAASSHANEIAPKGMVSTLQGSLIGTHFGLGQCIGNLFGGILMSAFGARWTLRAMGISAFSLGSIYLTSYTLFKWWKRKYGKPGDQFSSVSFNPLSTRPTASNPKTEINGEVLCDGVNSLNKQQKNSKLL